MLKSLTLKDFQCHRKTTIKLDPRVTVITGRNDKGKSSILRALRMLCLNRPSGKSFIRKGRSTATISLKVGKHTISRRIGTDNSYTLDGKKFKAFRSGVPPAIKKILSVDEINFQQQHEPVFWFTLSSGQVARELNKLIDLDTIDKVQTKVAKRLRETTAELKVCRNRLDTCTCIDRELSWVPGANVKMGKLDAAFCRMGLKSHQMSRIASLLGVAMGVHTDSQTLAVAAAGGRRLGLLYGAAGVSAAAAGRLGGLMGELAAVGNRPPIPAGLDRIEKVWKRYRSNKQEQFESLVNELEAQEKLVWQLRNQLEIKEKKLEERLGGRCPSCGGILTGTMTL